MSGNGKDPLTNKSTSKSPPALKRKSMVQSKKIGEDEFMAAAIGDVDWLKQSIRGNRGVINYDKNGLSALHLSAIHGRLECLRLLIEKFKLDINLPSQTGWRPLHLVISNQTGKRAFNCLMYLLEQDADTTVTNDDGITPLHQAASEGHVQCLKALVEGGAPADFKDYRGHTPIDLAKLWGHRKCARLLATEKWHREKQQLAVELNQLKKMEMQKVLRGIEVDQENQADKEFFGDLAFREWLDRRGLEPKPTGPRQPEYEEEPPEIQTTKPVITATPPQTNIAKGDGLFRANSIQPKPIVKPATPIRDDTSSSLRPTTHTSTQSDQKVIISRENTQPKVRIESPPPQQSAEEETKQKGVEMKGLHFSEWNHSTKTIDKDYVPILGDHYPRDEYSMRPKYSPKRHVETPTQQGDGDKHSVSEGPDERPVVYKCKHIGDVHKKKHYDADLIPRSEVGMHLSADPSSELFRSSLLLPVRTAAKKSRRRSKPFDLQSVMDMLERMNNEPPYFPVQESTNIRLEA